jgi:hypothetical protein
MRQKKWWLGILVIGMFSSAAMAVAPMGPPVATLTEGQSAVGLGYAYSDADLEVSGPLSGLTGDAELDSFTNNMYYGCIAYGISDTWNVCVAAGAADAAFDADGSGKDFDGDTDFGFAVQAKRTLHDNGSDTKWGTLFQYSRGKSSDTIQVAAGGQTFGRHAISMSAGKNNVDLDWYEVQLALGPAVQVNEDLCVYGGPFLHFLEGDLSIKDSSAQAEYELQQLWELGGYVGAVLNIGSNASLSLEFLYTGDGWGAGVGAMFPI